MVKRVKAVQELLGEHQDSVVARGLLREMGAAAPTEGGNGFAFGWLLRDEQAPPSNAAGAHAATVLPVPGHARLAVAGGLSAENEPS